jgi:hypothetical protein
MNPRFLVHPHTLILLRIFNSASFSPKCIGSKGSYFARPYPKIANARNANHLLVAIKHCIMRVNGGETMRTSTKVTILFVGMTGLFGNVAAVAQWVRGEATIALKSGESTDVYSLGYVSNCRSILKGLPEAEIVDGPPAVTASVMEEMVLPRGVGCANRVKGGILVLTAKDIEDPSFTPVTVRITYRTRDGDRKFSHVFNLSLIP